MIHAKSLTVAQQKVGKGCPAKARGGVGKIGLDFKTDPSKAVRVGLTKNQ